MAELGLELKRYIISGLNEANIACDDNKADKLVLLIMLLNQWNDKINLTSVRDPFDQVVLHIFDSAVVSSLLPQNAEEIADAGTGAGFPGLVLAVLNPDRKFYLIDSASKKTAFVRQAVIKMALDNVVVINKRIENITEKFFDCVVVRAFASLGKICDICLRILKKDGMLLAMKSNLGDQELKEVPQGVKIMKIVPLRVPMLEAQRQAVFLSVTD